MNRLHNIFMTDGFEEECQITSNPIK